MVLGRNCGLLFKIVASSSRLWPPLQNRGPLFKEVTEVQHLFFFFFFCMANKELLRADSHLVSEPEAGNREAQAL